MSSPVSHFTRASHPTDGIGIAFALGNRESPSVTGHLGPYGITPAKPGQSFAKYLQGSKNDGDTPPPP